MRLLHKMKSRDLVHMLDLFDRDVLDATGEPVYMQKASIEFFERIAGILPMHVPHLTNNELIRALEVLVKRDIGSERLFLHYIFLKIEKNVLKFSTDLYCRMIRAIADKNFVEDSIFWNEFVFKYVSVLKDGRTERVFSA
mmetsp:Transcript_1778/g.1216  ORF Transcript_1778/g.1216 Transcript_1778/m.1216 type:complete len:140 (+) Transcript_1778:585-1004(+)